MPRLRSSIRVAINGFGRIGRIFFRACMEDRHIEIVAVNDMGDAGKLAHLLKYDSVHRTLPVDVEAGPDYMVVGGRKIKVFAKPNPELLPWRDEGVDIVIEATGKLDTREAAEQHLKAGAGRVIFSSTGKKRSDSDITLVYGVNHESFDPKKHFIVSNASCTTNCLAPICRIVHDKWGIVNGEMCTIHSYTADQRLWDSLHDDDLRRARAAARSIVPTRTGAAKAIGEVLPELSGKMDGVAYRVPTLDGSVIHLVADVLIDTTREQVNAVLKDAAETNFKGIVQFIDAPLVSEDFIGNPHSAIVDSLLTRVTDRRKVIIVAWYDNEWGYSSRLRDIVNHVAAKCGWLGDQEVEQVIEREQLATPLVRQ